MYTYMYADLLFWQKQKQELRCLFPSSLPKFTFPGSHFPSPSMKLILALIVTYS